MSNRAKSAIILVLGVLFILAGVVVAMLAVSGTIDRVLSNEILQAFSGYFLGMMITIVLLVSGIILIALGTYFS